MKDIILAIVLTVIILIALAVFGVFIGLFDWLIAIIIGLIVAVLGVISACAVVYYVARDLSSGEQPSTANYSMDQQRRAKIQ